MLKHVYLVLCATFILGFVSGGVLFLQNNTGKEGDGDIEIDTEEFVITAHTYGGCERGGQCASYRILEGKTYTYITRDVDGMAVRSSGSLTRDDERTLVAYIDEVDFASLTTPFTGECEVVRGGIAYRYTIATNGEEYTFDSCETSLRGVPLFDALEEYFIDFNETHDTQNE